jgi:hypothetical protein
MQIVLIVGVDDHFIAHCFICLIVVGAYDRAITMIWACKMEVWFVKIGKKI